MLAVVVIRFLFEDILSIDLGNFGPVGIRGVLAALIDAHALLAAPVTGSDLVSLALLDKRTVLSWSWLGCLFCLEKAHVLESC